MSKNELSTFTFKSTALLSGVPITNMATIRVITINGEPWFVAADVCRALGFDISRGTHKYLGGLDADQKRPLSRLDSPEIFVGDRAPSHTLISEGGLYDKVLSAHKVNHYAKAFRKWVTDVVLPAIRKDGMYVAGEENLDLSTDVGLMTMAMRVQEGMKAKIERLTLERDDAQKKLEDTRGVIGTHMHTLARFARTMSHVNIMATKRDLLRLGYLYKTPSSYRVYAKHRSFFEEKFDESYGTIEIYVTEKGKALLIDLNAQGLLTRKKAA